MRVSALMQSNVATVRADEGLDVAAELMQRRGCGCVVVVRSRADVVGILTDRDVCMAALRTDRPLSRSRVGDFMTPDVFTCRDDESVADAERCMGRHQVRRLPVVDARGALRGILSLDDIAREARREEKLIAPQVSAETVGRTLGQIGRPRIIESAAPPPFD